MPKSSPTRLGIDMQIVPALDPAHLVLAEVLKPLVGGEPMGLTDENLQSRLHGLLLMAVSNAKGWIVLTTGNKSEIATGYFTLYGDAVGAPRRYQGHRENPGVRALRLPKTPGVFWPAPLEPIPISVMEKPPSAELRPEQRDDESLPPYDLLDPVLEAYVEPRSDQA